MLKNDSPKIFIVILNCNGQDYIRETLASAFRLDYPNFEVVLVDNNSTDGSFEMIKSSFSKIILLKNAEDIGLAAGNNIGVRYALERGARYILLLNNNSLAESNFLLPLIELMEKNKKIGLASPIILEKAPSEVWYAGGKIDWLRMKTYHQKNTPKKTCFDTGFISSCAMLIRPSVFKKIGLFDESYFLYWEDADFSVRAKKAGYDLAICPQSQIFHPIKKTSRNPQKNYWLIISSLLFFRKNSPFWLKPWIFFFVLAKRIKNWHNIKRQNTEEDKLIQKAYRDFFHHIY